MSYGYKNDEICEECNWKKTGICKECYNHMKFYRKGGKKDELAKL